jgi:hypothetical protein
VEHDYVGIDKWSIVRQLMGSIKTKMMDAVKAQIIANAALRANFYACVNLFKDFIAQERSVNGSERQIAVLNVTGDSGSDPNDHYVPDPEWQAMPRDEKTKIIAACKAAREARKASRGAAEAAMAGRKGVLPKCPSSPNGLQRRSNDRLLRHLVCKW